MRCDKAVEEIKLPQVNIVDNEVVRLPGRGGEDLIELCVHLAAGQGERVWGDCRLKVLPKVSGVSAPKTFALLYKPTAGNLARLVDGDVVVYLGS